MIWAAGLNSMSLNSSRINCSDMIDPSIIWRAMRNFGSQLISFIFLARQKNEAASTIWHKERTQNIMVTDLEVYYKIFH